MIEVKNLTKHFGDKKAVEDISFTVNDGEILGFLGPNGAGKSTTMNMLTGYISSTSGHALINGVDILEDPIKAKSFIGYLPELPPLYIDMTVKGYLNFIFDLKKCKMPRTAHIKDVCNLTKITDVQDRIIKNLSKGYKQRVGLAQALIGNPPVLILDEPTVGLDPKQIIEIRTLIKKLGKSHTVILSSHILPEIQAVCDRIIIIDKGVVVADDTTDNLSKKVATDHRLTVRVEGDKKQIIDVIKSINRVKYARADMEREPGVYEYEIEAEEGVDIRRELSKRLAEKNMPILMMRSADLALEDIFLKITMGEGVGLKSKSNKPDRRPEEVLKDVQFGFDVSGVMAKNEKKEAEETKADDTEAEEVEDKPKSANKNNSSKGKNNKNGGRK